MTNIFKSFEFWLAVLCALASALCASLGYPFASGVFAGMFILAGMVAIYYYVWP